MGWTKRIQIIMHGLEQKHVGKTNKFVQIANILGIELENLNLPKATLPADYWHYETKGEKLGTNFIHLVVENFTESYSIFENHAGCGKGYFVTKDGQHLALEKYSDRDAYKAGNKDKIIFIPDLVLLDIAETEVITIESKKYEFRQNGINELKNYDIFDERYLKIYYPQYKIVRTVVLYGSNNEKIAEVEVGFLLNANGKESYAHEIRKIHPTPKPPQLMKEIIEFFTKKDGLVFDYFMGTGGSLLGATLAGRKATGIDLCQKYIDAYKAAAEKLKLNICQTYCGDCLEALADKSIMENLLKNQQIDLVLIDPPYGEMMSKEKTGADIEVYGTVATPFTDDKRDFGNINRDEFLEKLKLSVELVLPYVKTRGYVVVFKKDLQPCKKKTNLLHSEIIYKLNEINNLNYKGLKIWADRSTKLFPYGYPFFFCGKSSASIYYDF